MEDMSSIFFMEIVISFIAGVFLLLLSGCMNNYHAFDFNATSQAECSLKCEDLMNEYSCFESLPSYSSSYVNGVMTKGQCSCYIRECGK